MPTDLENLLSLYPREVRPRTPPLALGNAGGTSGVRLYRFASAIGDLVARAWPVDGPHLAMIQRIHSWISQLADLPFIPIPIPTRDRRTVVVLSGRAWDVSPWMPGQPNTTLFRSAFTALAMVHNRLGPMPAQIPSPGLIARLEESERLLKTELAQFETTVGRAHDEAADLSRRWLAVARTGLMALVPRLRRDALRTMAIQPVLRDARRDHFLFEEDRLTGLVDFGAMGVDTPAADLARLLGEWVGDDRPLRAEALNAYSAIRPLSAVEAALIDVFEEANAWLGPARWVRWHYVDRRHFDDSDTVMIGLRRCLDRLATRIS